ncbi:MAG: hypothetical protein OXG13_17170 [Gemmatimonadaceae bacterium]|nr:hypothetical protein [Gemmatimonadaceae bacterium]
MLRRFTTLSTALLFLILAGCGDDDNPVDPDHSDEHHAEAFGLIIRSGGEELVRYENGEVDGVIEVGHERETPLLTVRFIAEDGDLFAPDADEGFSLGWEIGDESIAEVEQHEEDGPWAFHIVGLGEGETTLVLKINHGGHADFVSKEIEIHVEEGGPGEDHDHDDDHDDEEDDHDDDG